MRLTVRCPADGAVEVTVRDLESVVVRSGSDVQATYRCPLCGSPVVVGSEVAPDAIAWMLQHAPGCGCPQVSGRAGFRVGESSRVTSVYDDAYVEYFRRELAVASTLEPMLALMDIGERRGRDRSHVRRH
jgi:hypothetical protein